MNGHVAQETTNDGAWGGIANGVFGTVGYFSIRPGAASRAAARDDLRFGAWEAARDAAPCHYAVAGAGHIRRILDGFAGGP